MTSCATNSSTRGDAAKPHRKGDSLRGYVSKSFTEDYFDCGTEKEARGDSAP